MKDHGINIPRPLVPFKVLLADDDFDDRFFFQKAVDTLSIPNQLTTVGDGADLMTYLNNATIEKRPDILFLDLNMPKMKGLECLEEIKENNKLKHIPVVIYSTAFQKEVIDLAYKNGAHYYVRKTDFTHLQKALKHIFTLLVENKFTRPAIENFALAPL